MAQRPTRRSASRFLVIAALLLVSAGVVGLVANRSRLGTPYVAYDLVAQLDQATANVPLVPLEETFAFQGDNWLFRPNGNIQISRSSNFWNRLTFFPGRSGDGRGLVSFRYRTQGPGGGDHRLAFVFHEKATPNDRRRFEVMVLSEGTAEVRYSEIEPDGTLLVETVLGEAPVSPTNGDWREYQMRVAGDLVGLTIDGHDVFSCRLPSDLMERVNPLGAWGIELSRQGSSVHPSDALLRRLQVERETADGGMPLSTLSFRRNPNTDETILRYLNFKYSNTREHIPPARRTILKQIGLTLADNRTEFLPAIFAPEGSSYRFPLDVEPGDSLRLRYGLYQPPGSPVPVTATFVARLHIGDDIRALLSDTLSAEEETELRELDVRLPVRGSGLAELELAVIPPGDDEETDGDSFAVLGLWGAPQILRERGWLEKRRPNVIIISADTLRLDALSVYDAAMTGRTPSLEAFAQSATVFTNAYASSPWTMPSHFSLFSGLYPAHHGLNRAFGFNSAAYEDVTTLAQALANAGYVTAAIASDHSLDPAHGFDKGFHSFQDNRVRRAPPILPALRSFLEAHSADEFFLFFHSYDPHAPLSRKAELEKDDLNRIGPEVNYSDFVELGDVTDAEEKLVTELYKSAVAEYDDSFARIMELFEEFGVLDNSIIVFASDHGEELFERGVYQHGHSLYEELLRIPLIIKFPRGERFSPRYGKLTGLVDVFPTLLEYLNLETRAEIDGQSFLGALRGDGSTPRRYLLAESLAWGPERKAVITVDYKYIVTYAESDLPNLGPRAHFYDRLFDTGPGRELYHLREDPSERKNVLTEDEELATRLEALLKPLVEAQSRSRGAVEMDPDRVKALRSLGYIQ